MNRRCSYHSYENKQVISLQCWWEQMSGSSLALYHRQHNISVARSPTHVHYYSDSGSCDRVSAMATHMQLCPFHRKLFFSPRIRTTPPSCLCFAPENSRSPTWSQTITFVICVMVCNDCNNCFNRKSLETWKRAVWFYFVFVFVQILHDFYRLYMIY